LIAVGIVAALAAEARTLGPTTQRGAGPATLADGSLLCVSGIGEAAAQAAALALVQSGALGLVSWGVAGGLDPALAAGTLLLPAQVLARQAAPVPTDQPWRERVAAAVAVRVPLARGALLTSRDVLASVPEKAAAFAATGAVAVDMESYAIAQVAQAHRLPFIIVRAVVDAAADVLPGTLREAASGHGGLSIGRLLGSLALSPRDLPAVARLALGFRAAQRALRCAAHTGALTSPS